MTTFRNQVFLVAASLIAAGAFTQEDRRAKSHPASQAAEIEADANEMEWDAAEMEAVAADIERDSAEFERDAAEIEKEPVGMEGEMSEMAAEIDCDAGDDTDTEAPELETDRL